MTRFYPLYVRRSDGKLEVIGHHKRKEANQPTPEQLNKKPDSNGISDYYREVGMDETKHLDWRRKLGGMLVRDFGWSDSDKGYILVNFPENYRLYEHVKKAEGENKSVKTQKTHAGGGNERQDAYLYGHPMGRKKRYRSPADFYPHLYWLATDEAGDPDNCACKICTPEEFEEKKRAAIAEPASKTEPVKEESKAEPNVRQPSQAAPNLAPNVKPEPSPSITTAPRTVALNPVKSLPKPTKHDQALDLMYGTFVFRQGELVWYNRGSAWGLGIIIQRWRQGSEQSAARSYTIQPLSHPFTQPPAVTVSGDQNIRPWLAWSVPNFTFAALNGMRVTYDSADWRGMFNRKYGAGDVEVDGSILAAKAIDATYTTTDVMSRQQPQQGVVETHWNGVFLGAERVWVGDPVRLRNGSGLDIVVVHDIVETSRTSAFNNQVLEQSLSVLGDVYTLQQVAYANVSQPFPPGTDNSNLPQRLVEDLKQRNIRTIPNKHTAGFWKLIHQGARFEVRDLKGRWYEATLLLPLLNPGAFEAEFQHGDIAEAGLRMNSRLDCHSVGGQPTGVLDTRKADRISAFGKAVPSTLRIVEGSEAPQVPPTTQPDVHQSERMALDPVFDQAGAQGQQQAEDGTASHVASGSGLDEFMNLDGMDGDGMPGFGQEYGSQHGGAGAYYQ